MYPNILRKIYGSTNTHVVTGIVLSALSAFIHWILITTYEAGAINMLNLQTGQSRHREMELLAYSPRASKCRSWDSVLGVLAPTFMLFVTVLSSQPLGFPVTKEKAQVQNTFPPENAPVDRLRWAVGAVRQCTRILLFHFCSKCHRAYRNDAW